MEALQKLCAELCAELRVKLRAEHPYAELHAELLYAEPLYGLPK